MDNSKIKPIHQKQYQSTLIELLSRNKGGKLKSRTRVQNCKGNESTFFNTIGGTTINRTGNFLKGNFRVTDGASKAENLAYQMDRIEVAPVPVYAGNWVHETHYLKTVLNIEQAICNAQTDQLGVEEDIEILKAIGAGLQSGADAKIKVPTANIYGVTTEALTLKNFVTAMEVARLMLGTGERLTIIANKKDIATLRTSENYAGLSAEMKSYFGEQTVAGENIATGNIVTWRDDLLDGALTLAGTTDTATVGRMIVMVEKSVGVATWYDTVEAKITYHSDLSEYLLKSNISVGASIIDPRGIFVIQFKK
ncbi:MAG: phage capsid protein [Paraclostridium sp.]